MVEVSEEIRTISLSRYFFGWLSLNWKVLLERLEDFCWKSASYLITEATFHTDYVKGEHWWRAITIKDVEGN